MKLVVSFVLATLCLSFTVFGQQTTGPVVNTDSVHIEVDDDADDVGKFVVITKHVERLVVSNDGKVGIATNAPTAFIDINPPATGPHEVINVRTNEPGGGNFRLSYYSTPNIFTDPGGLLTGRTLKSFPWGYNPPGTANYNPNDSSLFYNSEIGYVTAAGRPQDEWWFGSRAPGYAFTRPLSIDLYRDNGQTEIALSTPRVIVRNTDAVVHNLWLEFLSSPTTGSLNLYNDSAISYSGTRKYYVSHHGVGVLGRDLSDSRVWNFVFGGAQMETARFFEGDTLASGPLKICMGQENGCLQLSSNLRWQMNGPAAGDIQTAFDVAEAGTASKIVKRDASGAVNVSAIKIGGVTVLDGQCSAILDPEPGERINNVTTIAILHCLREIKLLAQ